MHILMMIGELMRCVGRAGGGVLCVYVVLCGLVKRYNENIVVFLLIKKCV